MFIRLLLASIALIIIGQTPLITPALTASARLANPLQYSAYRLSQNLKKELDFVLNLRRLRVENLELSEKVLKLESILANHKELEEENRLLREQVGLPALPDRQAGGRQGVDAQNLVLAKIIGRSARGGEAVVTVDKGSEAGLREGAAVIFKNLLLGEVFLVEPQRAKVRLLTDSQFVVAALDQDSPDRARGLLNGQYGTTAVLQKVLPTENLVVGDTIITSGEDGKFEKGLVLGVVKKVFGQEAGVFKGAELRLMVDFDSLEKVFVVL